MAISSEKKTPGRFQRLRKYVFVLTTGRSGSSFFADMVNKNAENASSEHEPDLVPVDESTRWYYDGREDELARLAEMKLRRLRRGEAICALPLADRFYRRFARSRTKRLIPRVPMREIYVEVDNGFLKSYGYHLYDAVPDLEFVHLTRDPLLQAKSAENRRYHPSPERPYFLWPTWERNTLRLGEEVTAGLSDFQLALWYWFEMEFRYVDFISRFGIEPVTHIDVDDLNDPQKVHDLFGLLGIRHRPLNLDANRNLGPRESRLSDRDHQEVRDFLRLVPDEAMARLPRTYGLEKI